MGQNKVALITGSGKHRVGYHIAEALADRGNSLAIHYRTSETEAKAAVSRFQARSIDCIAIQADLTDESAVARLVDGCLDHFGHIDVLVNAAATWKRRTLEETSAADVLQEFANNTLSTFLCSQRAGLAMVKQPKGGTIITIGDWATVRPYVDHSAYLTSKGCIPTLTRTLAVELGTRNPAVRVNCILPGPVMLPPDLPAAERRAAIEGTLVKREGRPENIAHAVLFLVENDFVTGSCLTVDGGRSIFAAETGENSP